MNRREFLTALGIAAVAPNLGCASAGAGASTGTRRLKKVGIQLYTLRDDARRDLEGTLVNIAQTGYKEVELLSSMNNFGMPPERLRAILDRNGLRAPSTHVETGIFNDLDRQIDAAKILGHQYLIVASLPDGEKLGLGIVDFRRLLAMIDHIDDKHLYVEQETYPGVPLDSVKRDYAYISQLQF